jgi:hypothetical protein
MKVSGIFELSERLAEYFALAGDPLAVSPCAAMREVSYSHIRVLLARPADFDQCLS